MTRQILLVEDNDCLAEVLADYLEEAGYHVHAEQTAQEALAYMTRAAVDIGLLDVRLPGMDGYTLCAALQQHGNLPVILMTGACTEKAKQQARQVGADQMLSKPFRLDELERVIAQILQGKG